MPQRPHDLCICPSCDLVISQLPELSEGNALHCPRCGHKLKSSKSLQFSETLALSLACLITLIIANFYPLLSFDFLGSESHANILEGTILLFDNGYYFVGGVVLLASVVAPVAVFSLVAINSFLLMQKRKTPGLASMLHYQDSLIHWSMLEVFLVSFIVSLVKLIELSDIKLGWGLWSICLTIVFSGRLLLGIDSQRFWERYAAIS